MAEQSENSREGNSMLLRKCKARPDQTRGDGVIRSLARVDVDLGDQGLHSLMIDIWSAPLCVLESGGPTVTPGSLWEAYAGML